MAIKNSELSVTILGSGTCVPSLRRSSCSALIETGGKKLVFDLGPGTMRRLLEVDTKIFDISFIFFSHFHPDHTGELVSFLFATKYPDKATTIRRDTFKVDKTETLANNQAKLMTNPALDNYLNLLAVPPYGGSLFEYFVNSVNGKQLE